MNVPGRAPSAPGPALLVAGDLVARYVVEGPLGAGTMGQVFAARDPELDRPIAIKLVHDAGSPDEERLLLEEARVLARLTHPNVVRVYDAGIATTRGGRKAFLAMERASGRTLWDWLRAGPYPWRDVARRMADAARGLGAAHEAGLVHGDFKPSNVLLAVDDRPLVADFGLARPHGEGMTGELTGDGTPAFAAPELKRGARPSPASDQFSFGVSLYEALYNVLPFPGEDLVAIDRMAASGPPPGGRRLPRRLRAVLSRCLAPHPAARFGSLAEVAAALDAATTPVRASVLIAAAATAALAVVAVWPSHVPTPPPACTALALRVRTTFDARVRQAGRDAFARSGKPFAATSWSRVEGALRTLVAETRRAGDAMCREADRSPDGEAVLVRKLECLDRVLTSVDTFATTFARIDPERVESAVGATYTIPRPSSCEHPGVAEGGGLVARLHVRQLRDAMTAVRVSTRSGPAEAARDDLERIQAEARRLDARSLEAEALALLAQLDHNATDLPSNLRRTEAALLAAEASGDDRLAAHLAFAMADALSEAPGRASEAWSWVNLGAARLQRIGGDPILEADLASVRGGIHFRLGEFETALAETTTSLTLRKRVLPPGHPHIAETLSMRGTNLFGLGRFEEARDAHREAFDELERSLGATHPSLLPVLNNLANAEDRLKNYAGAAEMHRRSLALRETLFGPRSRSVVGSRINLALALVHGGDEVGARAELVGVLGLLDALGRPDDPAIPIALINLADLDLEEGAPTQAEAHLARALALSPSDGRKPHPRMAILETTLARARCELGRCEEALAGLDRANVAQAMLPPDHSDRIYPLLGRARVLVELGRGREAAVAATDALARLAKLQAGPEDLGPVRVLHARALGLLGRRAQAVTEARRARAELVAAKLPTVDIDAFLERPRPRARRRR